MCRYVYDVTESVTPPFSLSPSRGRGKFNLFNYWCKAIFNTAIVQNGLQLVDNMLGLDIRLYRILA